MTRSLYCFCHLRCCLSTIDSLISILQFKSRHILSSDSRDTKSVKLNPLTTQHNNRHTMWTLKRRRFITQGETVGHLGIDFTLSLMPIHLLGWFQVYFHNECLKIYMYVHDLFFISTPKIERILCSQDWILQFNNSLSHLMSSFLCKPG